MDFIDAKIWSGSCLEVKFTLPAQRGIVIGKDYYAVVVTSVIVTVRCAELLCGDKLTNRWN